MRRVLSTIRKFLDRVDPESTVGDRVAGLDAFTGVFAKISQRLPAEQLARVVNVGVEVIAGEFEQFEEPASEADEFTTAAATQNAMELTQGSGDHIWGNRLKLSGSLERVLAEMSATQSEMGAEEFSEFEIQKARDDARNALKIAVCFYEAVFWIYGPQAFGLRMAAFIGRTVPKDAIFVITLGLARLRRHSNQFYSTVEFAGLADQSEKIWLMSEYFREIQNSHSDLREIVGPKRLKVAFSDSHEFNKLIKELAGYEFPTPDFRPWDQWKKLSRKTMSPGLLAMSIGAPSRLDLTDILPSESDPPSL